MLSFDLGLTKTGSTSDRKALAGKVLGYNLVKQFPPGGSGWIISVRC